MIDLIHSRTKTNLINIHNQAETSHLYNYPVSMWQSWRDCDTAIQIKQNNWTHRRGGKRWGPTQSQQSHQKK